MRKAAHSAEKEATPESKQICLECKFDMVEPAISRTRRGKRIGRTNGTNCESLQRIRVHGYFLPSDRRTQSRSHKAPEQSPCQRKVLNDSMRKGMPFTSGASVARYAYDMVHHGTKIYVNKCTAPARTVQPSAPKTARQRCFATGNMQFLYVQPAEAACQSHE
jgi:hypothetical protein